MPVQQNMINELRVAVGKNQPDDYVISPLDHAKQFRERAPSLAGLLEGSRVKGQAESYQVADHEAGEAQKRFQSLSSRARWCVFVAACFTGSLLALGNFADWSGPWREALAVVLPVGGLVSGVLAGIWLNQIGSGKLLSRWMEKRAEAESQRLRYFSHVTEPSDDLETGILQLEYFRRFQLDVQRTYYLRRGQDHRAASEGAVSMSSWSMGVFALANGLVVLQGIEWAGIAAVAVAAQAFASLVANREAVGQDTRNSERYARTWQTLQELSERLDEVRWATASGNKEALPQFVEAVHEQLSLEHRQWLKGGEEISSAVARLTKTLEENPAGAVN